MNPFDVIAYFDQISDFLSGVSDIFGGLFSALEVVFGWADIEKPAE
ncbi:hypothetical protein CUROG_01660 [Corynebacterium urogenitale]|uniref:Cell wall channel n=1 Tax=Corynebacterium urogenitale TaxID=2487892 RepID=A0A5J6Z6A2_9CORY|nr:PorACj family cell wall channel-forming small protein [Corynebacterium urogenitale]QFQ01732.1 hypothetical protein CUROG_01660 [Corynebacterium urogenitale]